MDNEAKKGPEGYGLTMSVEEAAAIIPMGRNQAYEACRAGKFPVLHVNRSYRVLTKPFLKMLGVDA